MAGNVTRIVTTGGLRERSINGLALARPLHSLFGGTQTHNEGDNMDTFLCLCFAALLAFAICGPKVHKHDDGTWYACDRYAQH